MFETLKDETDQCIAWALLAWDIVGGLDDHPGTFHCLVRNIGMASTEIHYEIRTPHLVFRYESLEHMSENWQSTERPVFVREFRNLPAGVQVGIESDNQLFPTYTVRISGIAREAADRITSRMQTFFELLEQSFS